MATAGDIVRRALRLNSVLTRGETLAAEDGEEGLQALNELLHSWYANNILVPSLTREQVTLTTGKAQYTIGSGADLDTARPLTITTIVIRDSGTDYELREISQRWWSQISVKNEKERPDRFYYEESYPNGNLYLDSQPDQNYTAFITSYKGHSDFSSLSTSLGLPPLYERALAFNLAVDMAPEYGKEVSQTVLNQARQSKLYVIQRHAQNRPVEASMDYSLTHGGADQYDIRSDN
jgi:hypothetical protein